MPARSRRPLPHRAAGLLLLLVGPALGYVLAACAMMLWPAAGDPGPATPEVEAYVISNGVHTDLVLPLHAAGVDWRGFFPPTDALDAPADAAFVAIGWGDREFYLHTPTWADLTASRALGAVLGRNPALLHVTWLSRAQLPPGDTWRLPLSAAQYRRLAAHVRHTLPEAAPRKIGGIHYGRQDAFYEAIGTYHLLRTCNQWTADALRAAGVRVSRWTPFVFNVVWHLEPAAPTP